MNNLRLRPCLYIAPVTPIRHDGMLDIATIPRLCRLLQDRGAEGFYVGGGTGEGLLLDCDSRIRLLQAWRNAAGPRVPLISHVTSASMKDAHRLARHAVSEGVIGISAMAPIVGAVRTPMDLVNYLADVASAAPDKPFFYYHNPAATRVSFTASSILEAAQDSVPSLQGVKFTDENLMDLSICMRFDGGRFRIFYGKDEALLPARIIGATQFIGGAFNVISPLVTKCLRSFAAGRLDDARDSYHTIVDVIAILRKFGGLCAVKATMRLLGVDCGPMLRPARTLDESESLTLFAALKAIWPEIAGESLVTEEPIVEEDEIATA
ncbi:MAG TPA: dihydrodipicolinate synthase family protein [Tepidisphaeraceae bacterium]|nr:dihydrodipicolinate synthase family protein [Tepidisphaeraceae bacterium]